MEEPVHTLLAGWESFYIIAGALTGLQFVVMALVADRRNIGSSPEIAAFGTPTVLHFCAALLASALLSAPWTSLSPAGLSLAACGVAGMVYVAIVVRRARRTEGYKPVLEDWIWHTILPLIAYVMLLVGGILLPTSSGPGLDLIAASTLGLVFIGIHNAWDTITFIAVDARAGSGTESTSQEHR